MKDEYQPQLFLANKTGVTSPTDQDNVSLHVRGDVSISNRLHLTELVADSFMETSDERKKNVLNKLDDRIGRFEKTSAHRVRVEEEQQACNRLQRPICSSNQTSAREDSGEGLALSYSSINVHTTNALIHLLKQIKS